MDDILVRLSRSRFRSRFRLSPAEVGYLRRKGLQTVLQQARELLSQRLASAAPHNDGRQTPWRGHPVFVAQHATATCCRSCLRKWHGIEQARPLTAEEIEYSVAIIGRWLVENGPRDDLPAASTDVQLPLFDD